VHCRSLTAPIRVGREADTPAKRALARVPAGPLSLSSVTTPLRTATTTEPGHGICAARHSGDTD